MVTYNGERNTAKEMMLPVKTMTRRQKRNIHQHLLTNDYFYFSLHIYLIFSISVLRFYELKK